MAKTTKKNETIKKKVDIIKSADFNIETLIDNEDLLEIVIKIDALIVPAERPRVRGFGSGLYDPLCNYKDAINKKLKNLYKHELLTGEVQMDILLYKKVPDSYPAWKRLYGCAGMINPIDKPDLDNVEKTIMDSFKNVIWNDDCQVVKLSSKKYYHDKDLTFIKITYNRNNNNNIIKGRLKKEDKENLEKIIKDRKIGF